MQSTSEWNPGDIIELDGECYQVLENLGGRGRVRHFPSDEELGFELDWQGGRRIGQAALPAPSPCASGGSCPTYEIRPQRANDPNIIARQG